MLQVAQQVKFSKKHPDIFTQNLTELFNKANLSRKENQPI
jgi:hypothetical protein